MQKNIGWSETKNSMDAGVASNLRKLQS